MASANNKKNLSESENERKISSGTLAYLPCSISPLEGVDHLLCLGKFPEFKKSRREACLFTLFNQSECRLKLASYLVIIIALDQVHKRSCETVKKGEACLLS